MKILKLNKYYSIYKYIVIYIQACFSVSQLMSLTKNPIASRRDWKSTDLASIKDSTPKLSAHDRERENFNIIYMVYTNASIQ